MLIKFSNNRKYNSTFFRASFVLISILLSLTTSELFTQEKTYTVVLDAGHGGKDPGNIGNGYREKNITLKVVKEIGKLLDKYDDIKVDYTRKTDVLIDLWRRGEIANDKKADLFVSIHCDGHTSKAYGSSTFVLGLHANKRNFEVAKKENAAILFEDNYKERYKGFDPNSPESFIGLTLMQEENLDKSLSIANEVQKNFRTKLKRRDRGVRQAGFVVLYQTYMPSILVELGFLTNKNEGQYLNSSKGQKELAKQITAAIRKYFDNLKLNTVSTQDVVIIDVPDQETDTDDSNLDESSKNEKILFKIQIASSKKKIRTKSYNFKGLRDVERVKVGIYYKYYYGHSSDYNETKKALKKAKKKGYNSAFITAFKNGKKVSLSKVLK